jgi:2-succinyl-5-enolpyruvyl-6-hydroxy-3-cyclohexene-1-carboxylate synthase
MMLSDKKAIKDILILLEKKGVKHIIISPGSRNAPFSISLHNHPAFDVLSIADERSAAFFGLGIAQQSKRPVVLICTSGTAPLNYAPAIAEAYYQEVPLLIITADRPMEWVDQGEGQTINQSGMYDNYVRGAFNMTQDMNDGDLEWYNARQINEAIDLAMWPIPGPVHLNFPLRESLYKTDSFVPQTKVIERVYSTPFLEKQVLSDLGQIISQKKKVMVLVGQFSHDDQLINSLQDFSALENVIFFTESHSGLDSPDFIGCVDRMIMTMTEQELDAIRPELLITIGTNIISRKVKAFLRHESLDHWHVAEDGQVLDTFKRLVKVIPVNGLSFFSSVMPFISGVSSAYRQTMLALNFEKRKAGEAYIENAVFSDLKAIHTIVQSTPADTDIQMGNSSIVRYIQLFDRPSSLRFFGNRGVSGIDGCSSTAAGAAYVTQRNTLLISGDISFFYDVNAFWNNYISSKLKVIVINNGGGGIFRIIDGPKTSDALEKYFETHHQRTCEGVANMYGIDYLTANNGDDLSASLSKLLAHPHCCILEVFTPRLENDSVLKGFFTFIKQHTAK